MTFCIFITSSLSWGIYMQIIFKGHAIHLCLEFNSIGANGLIRLHTCEGSTEEEDLSGKPASLSFILTRSLYREPPCGG